MAEKEAPRRPRAGEIFGFAAGKIHAPAEEKRLYAALARGEETKGVDMTKFPGWDASDFKALGILIGDGSPESEDEYRLDAATREVRPAETREHRADTHTRPKIDADYESG